MRIPGTSQFLAGQGRAPAPVDGARPRAIDDDLRAGVQKLSTRASSVLKSACMNLELAAQSVREALKQAGRGLVDREFLLELVVLAAVAREHILVIGPPGTAKSEAVRRVSRALGGRYFEYLMGRFTEPSEIFGPVDLRRLREGFVETETAGMLPEAEIAFLDEVFLGSTAFLNTLLGVLNERVFRRGHTRLDCPLRVCVGASNALPADESLAAFADRFLVRTFVEGVSDSMIEDLLATPERVEIHAPAGIEHLDSLARAAGAAIMDDVAPRIADAVRLLRKAGVHLSDRRIVKTRKLVAAAAALAGRERATGSDLWAIFYVLPTAEDQAQGREVLRGLLEEAENQTLPAAAEDASLGVKARAERLLRAAELSLARDSDESETLRREGILREIDATFGADLPESLRAIRPRLITAIN